MQCPYAKFVVEHFHCVVLVQIEEEAYQDDLGLSLGTLGKSSSGRVRGPLIDSKTKARISKTLQVLHVILVALSSDTGCRCCFCTCVDPIYILKLIENVETGRKLMSTLSAIISNAVASHLLVDSTYFLCQVLLKVKVIFALVMSKM